MEFSAVNTIWVLVASALVFFMQAGFAMVETGFTRAKNAGNIIMKNLMDFCIGTVVFIIIGFGLFLGEDLVGLIGKPGFDIFTAYDKFDWSAFVFNLVFCATAATIVSGAMAERTKFLSYCIYSAVISAVIYPVEAHWIWGGGWLAQLGFIDFAGSAAIHTVGGVSALIGAIILGPRIGKYGKNGKVNAIPGHSLTLGALGVFILWFGWYGFNGAAASNTDFLGQIFLTTTISLPESFPLQKEREATSVVSSISIFFFNCATSSSIAPIIPIMVSTSFFVTIYSTPPACALVALTVLQSRSPRS